MRAWALWYTYKRDGNSASRLFRVSRILRNPLTVTCSYRQSALDPGSEVMARCGLRPGLPVSFVTGVPVVAGCLRVLPAGRWFRYFRGIRAGPGGDRRAGGAGWRAVPGDQGEREPQVRQDITASRDAYGAGRDQTVVNVITGGQPPEPGAGWCPGA
jgi:hypothetical protein